MRPSNIFKDIGWSEALAFVKTVQFNGTVRFNRQNRVRREVEDGGRERLEFVLDAYQYWELSQLTGVSYADFRSWCLQVVDYGKRRGLDETETTLLVAYVLKKVGYKNNTGSVTALFNKIGLKGTTNHLSYFGDRLRTWCWESKPVEEHKVARMKEVMSQQLFAAKGSNYGRKMSFREYVDNPTLWATSGSTEMRELIPPGWLNNKGGLAYGVTSDKVYKAVMAEFESGRNECSVIVKDEVGGPRAVILANMATYLGTRIVTGKLYRL